jgi:type IV pilus assembly protein PilE
MNRNGDRRNAAGFTLIELLVVVTIIGILSAIAMPMYGDYVKRGKIAEAHGTLSDLRVKMEQIYQDQRKYGTATVCGVAAPAAAKYFTYTCVSSTANAVGDQKYTWTAAGVVAQGMSGFTYTVNESNTKATSLTTASGWVAATTAYTCWLSRKGSC